jgi:hypothetical protein
MSVVVANSTANPIPVVVSGGGLTGRVTVNNTVANPLPVTVEGGGITGEVVVLNGPLDPVSVKVEGIVNRALCTRSVASFTHPYAPLVHPERPMSNNSAYFLCQSFAPLTFEQATATGGSLRLASACRLLVDLRPTATAGLGLLINTNFPGTSRHRIVARFFVPSSAFIQAGALDPAATHSLSIFESTSTTPWNYAFSNMDSPTLNPWGCMATVISGTCSTRANQLLSLESTPTPSAPIAELVLEGGAFVGYLYLAWIVSNPEAVVTLPFGLNVRVVITVELGWDALA